jgi:hypothetical protein
VQTEEGGRGATKSPRRREKNAAASTLAKLRWARASEEELRASITKMGVGGQGNGTPVKVTRTAQNP